MKRLVKMVALALAVGLLVLPLAGCSSAPPATAPPATAPPATAAPTDAALTDAEKAWCPGYIPAIYRAGMRIGAPPPV